MKKTKMLLILVLVVIMLAGCTPQQEVNKAPSVVGVKDVKCVVNSTVDFLDGVAALDKEDGDITPQLQITVTPQVDVNDGYATFTEVGEYTVNYLITDSKGRTAQKRAYVDVVDRETYRSFGMPEGFAAEADGAATIETCGVINGVFKLNACGGEIAEDIRLVRTFTLNDNAFSTNDYVEFTFSYEVKSNVAGKIKVQADGDDCAEIAVVAGANVLSFTHTVPQDDENREVEIALCLGGLNGNVEWEIGKVEIEFPQKEGTLLELVPNFNFTGRVDPRIDNGGGTNGLEGNAWPENGGSMARLEIKNPSNNSGDIWCGGMFIDTGVTLKAGVTYTVSFNVECVPYPIGSTRTEDDNFEVIIQRDKWGEKKIKTLYHPSGKVTEEIEVDNTTAGPLFIYVQSGTQANQINLSELSVQEHLGAVGKDTYTVSDFTEFHAGGYNSVLTTDRGNFTYVIENFSAADGDHKVMSPSFYVAGSGANYVVTFKAKASAPIDMLVAGPVPGSWEPQLFFWQGKLSTEETVFTFFCNGSGSDRLFTLEWHFGSGNNQKYNNVTIEITDIRVCLRNGELDG
ncbi:MAG: hypothetical protein J1F65_02600 [Clostridiales bacterium]|nr:hypothetical protein [Clostridiales bacterium]